jgi:hypothetical protein
MTQKIDRWFYAIDDEEPQKRFIPQVLLDLISDIHPMDSIELPEEIFSEL